MRYMHRWGSGDSFNGIGGESKKVSKIVGPGNIYVTAAKIVFGGRD